MEQREQSKIEKEVAGIISECIDKVVVIDHMFEAWDGGDMQPPDSQCFWGGMRTISRDVADKLNDVTNLIHWGGKTITSNEKPPGCCNIHGGMATTSTLEIAMTKNAVAPDADQDQGGNVQEQQAGGSMAETVITEEAMAKAVEGMTDALKYISNAVESLDMLQSVLDSAICDMDYNPMSTLAESIRAGIKDVTASLDDMAREPLQLSFDALGAKGKGSTGRFQWRATAEPTGAV